MQKVVDRVMQAYRLMVSLAPEEEVATRERLEMHLATLTGDENTLAVEGLKFLRKPRPMRRRRSPEELGHAR